MNKSFPGSPERKNNFEWYNSMVYKKNTEISTKYSFSLCMRIHNIIKRYQVIYLWKNWKTNHNWKRSKIHSQKIDPLLRLNDTLFSYTTKSILKSLWSKHFLLHVFFIHVIFSLTVKVYVSLKVLNKMQTLTTILKSLSSRHKQFPRWSHYMNQDLQFIS